MARKNLAVRPDIRIKPDLSAEERKKESLLLMERRSLIDAGVERKDIRMSGNSIYVKKKKYGSIEHGKFEKGPDVQGVDTRPSVSVSVSPVVHSVTGQDSVTNHAASQSSISPASEDCNATGHDSTCLS